MPGSKPCLPGCPCKKCDRSPLEDRFWARVDLDGPIDGVLGTRCWVWTGFCDHHGYGKISLGEKNGKVVFSHRVCYGFLVRPLVGVERLDHICHNPACVRPEHLRIVTQKQNNENRGVLNRNNTSGVRGVYWNRGRGKWQAYVTHNKKAMYLGLFSDIKEAEAVVIKKRNELFTHNDLDRLLT